MKINVLFLFLSLSVPVAATAGSLWDGTDAPTGSATASSGVTGSSIKIDQDADAQIDEKVSALELALGLENSKSPTLGKTPEEKQKIVKTVTAKKKVRQPRANVAVDDELTFKSGSAELTAGAERSVDALAKVYRGNPDSVRYLVIDGHTDAQGDDAANMSLSKARAESVKNKLMEKGIPPAAIKINGFGETRLLPGVSPESALNRRVEYSVAK